MGRREDSGNSHWIRWAEKGQGRMGESPWANPARFIDNSPYYRIDRIHTPLLIVAGEGHMIATWSTASAVDVSQRMVEFLDKHLRSH
jgi:hypothetical protein